MIGTTVRYMLGTAIGGVVALTPTQLVDSTYVHVKKTLESSIKGGLTSYFPVDVIVKHNTGRDRWDQFVQHVYINGKGVPYTSPVLLPQHQVQITSSNCKISFDSEKYYKAWKEIAPKGLDGTNGIYSFGNNNIIECSFNIPEVFAGLESRVGTGGINFEEREVPVRFDKSENLVTIASPGYEVEVTKSEIEYLLKNPPEEILRTKIILPDAVFYSFTIPKPRMNSQ